jgi:type IV secretory pathway TraG/TraD family ATPase VirD4
MHVSRSDPDFSIMTFQSLPAMRVKMPALGIHSFLNNLKIDMIYGMKETNGYEYLSEIINYY